MNEEDVRIILRRNELKDMIHVAVSDVTKLIDEYNILHMQSWTTEHCQSPKGFAVLTAIATAIEEQVGGK